MEWWRRGSQRPCRVAEWFGIRGSRPLGLEQWLCPCSDSSADADTDTDTLANSDTRCCTCAPTAANCCTCARTCAVRPRAGRLLPVKQLGYLLQAGRVLPHLRSREHRTNRHRRSDRL